MKKKILLVDDSPLSLQLMADMLGESEFDVTLMSCAVAASEKVASSQFDMIITDLNMPDMDGIEFVRRARLNPSCKFTPIIMVSSEGSDAKIAEAKQIGISTFLSKPVKEARLKGMIQMTLGG